jgi:hypothetical protein
MFFITVQLQNYTVAPNIALTFHICDGRQHFVFPFYPNSFPNAISHILAILQLNWVKISVWNTCRTLFILTSVWVTYKTGFWNGWFDSLASYTFTQFWTTGNTALPLFYILQFTVTYALGFSVVTSRILAMDLSQSHRNFNLHIKSSWYSLIPFLPFLQLPFRRNHPIHFRLMFCTPRYSVSTTIFLSYRTLSITTLHVPYGEHRPVLCRMRVYWSVT